MFVYVLNKNGKALMPCKPRKSKKLKLLEPVKGWLINMEAVIPPRPVEVVVSLPK